MVCRSAHLGREHHHPDRPRPVGPLAFGLTDGDSQAWSVRNGIAGQPFRRSRRTAVTEQGQPLQHTHRTQERSYVLPDQRIQHEAVEVIAAGATDALDQAREVTLAAHLTQRADPAHQKTATADCADPDASPWPAPSGGCAASFLLCLACTNSL
ncbi:hypothetical protein OG455_37835 [Kitasatospora sp. NBC_01287]|uniref:hypothetical protein n=1 Tax=Kitasatospora sp. NBC_01287 TaxID=2903573 RepID=UPI002250331F|nr:hypothetical protein [Kitasatospora sp. NBC_01287]MCX4751203.1 hypothetical protein [Kitasatospora sp. NBC_01287]